MDGKPAHIAALFLLCCLSTFSQILLKKAAQKEHASFLRQYLNPYTLVGYLFFFIVLVTNIYLLRFIPVSVNSVVSESVPLVLSFVAGRFFFHETITVTELMGALFIIAGIILIIL